MDRRLAGLIGGLAAGAVMTGLMLAGRKAGVLDETLDKKSEDWLDDTLGTRSWAGEAGTMLIEQANHAFASASFGYSYAAMREHASDVPAALLGGLYGGGLYAVNIAGVAPLLGITEGEQNVPGRTRLQRLALHVAYGVIVALVVDALEGEGEPA